jgi:hypothetical protein
MLFPFLIRPTIRVVNHCSFSSLYSTSTLPCPRSFLNASDCGMTSEKLLIIPLFLGSVLTQAVDLSPVADSDLIKYGSHTSLRFNSSSSTDFFPSSLSLIVQTSRLMDPRPSSLPGEQSVRFCALSGCPTVTVALPRHEDVITSSLG